MRGLTHSTSSADLLKVLKPSLLKLNLLKLNLEKLNLLKLHLLKLTLWNLLVRVLLGFTYEAHISDCMEVVVVGPIHCR